MPGPKVQLLVEKRCLPRSETTTKIEQILAFSFSRLFKLRPDFIPKFTEFRDLNDVDQLLTWQELKGHPKKLSFAFGLAINSLNDGDVFIAKIESLGTKHLEKLETEDMKVSMI